MGIPGSCGSEKERIVAWGSANLQKLCLDPAARFLQSLGAGAVVAGAPRWAFARTFDPTREPAPPVRDPKYREWSTAALAEAKRLGCSYADIRFTRNRAQNIGVRNGQILRGGGGFGGGDATETYGFGVRVIHSGVWGFASSPLVTPEEIKRVTGVATDVARASAIAKKRDVQLAPVPAYDEFWQVPIEKDPWEVPLEEKDRAALRTSPRRCRRTRRCCSRSRR